MCYVEVPVCVCVSGSPAGIGITKPDVEPEEKRG